jgi:hypothetical protein
VASEEPGEPGSFHVLLEVVLHEAGEARRLALLIGGAARGLRKRERPAVVRVGLRGDDARGAVVRIGRQPEGLLVVDDHLHVRAVHRDVVAAVDILEIVGDLEAGAALEKRLLERDIVVHEVAREVVVVPAEIGAAEVERLQVREALVEPAGAADVAEIAVIGTVRLAA